MTGRNPRPYLLLLPHPLKKKKILEGRTANCLNLPGRNERTKLKNKGREHPRKRKGRVDSWARVDGQSDGASDHGREIRLRIELKMAALLTEQRALGDDGGPRGPSNPGWSRPPLRGPRRGGSQTAVWTDKKNGRGSKRYWG